MSRAYRIGVCEEQTVVIKGDDEVCSKLEILQILPQEQTKELLKAELEKEGFEEKEGIMIKVDGNEKITIDPNCGEIIISSNEQEEVVIKKQGDATWYEENSEEMKERSIESKKKSLQQEIEKDRKGKEKELQIKTSERLEKKLIDVKPQLDKVVNKVTREALKRKASQMGEITELKEDDTSGNMIIKVEL